MSSPREGLSPTALGSRPPQFRLWHALTLVTVLAIVLAVASPYLRLWTTAQWQLLGLCLAAFLAGLLPLCILIRMRDAPPRGLGSPRFQASITMGGRRFFATAMLVLAFAIASLALRMAASSFGQGSGRFVVLVQLFNAGAMTMAAVNIYRGQVVWICDEGISVGFALRPWQSIQLLDDTFELSLRIRTQWLGKQWIDFPCAASRDFVTDQIRMTLIPRVSAWAQQVRHANGRQPP